MRCFKVRKGLSHSSHNFGKIARIEAMITKMCKYTYLEEVGAQLIARRAARTVSPVPYLRPHADLGLVPI